MGRPSLRSSLVVGTILWTIGVVTVVHFVSILLLTHGPSGALVHWFLISLTALGLLVAGLAQMQREMFS